MPQLTLVKVAGTSPVVNQLTLLKVSGTGAAVVAPQLSLLKVSGTGPVAVIVNPPPAQTVEPLSTVTLTASLQNGLTADSWSWRQISGPTTGIQGTGQTVTITAPADMNGTTVVIGVKATVGGTTSTEKTTTVTVLPQTEWWLDPVGVWQPRLPVVIL